MNREHQVRLLFKKYLSNDCTAEEAAGLIDIIRSGENQALIEALISEHFEDGGTAQLLHTTASAAIFRKLRLTAPTDNIEKKPFRMFSRYVKAAAIIAVLLTSSFFVYNFLPYQNKNVPTASVVQDIAPGGNRAILVLSDGKQVELDNWQVGSITEDGGAVIKKSADGQLAYFTTNTATKLNAVNTVKTPKGGQYQVVLPDGSKVWLNAASSITYPATFNENERRVTLTGEGYFEITTLVKNKKKIPFIVETGKQKIEVLGTRFNVNAYDDETGIKTTLIEGKVKVSTENETVILKPSQEFNLRSEGISTKKVDVEPAIDWKNGDFIFADEDIKSIMRKIARWYNIEVVYDTAIPNENLSGQISRDRNLSEVLRVLELSSDNKFRIENNTVHISYEKSNI